MRGNPTEGVTSKKCNYAGGCILSHDYFGEDDVEKPRSGNSPANGESLWWNHETTLVGAETRSADIEGIDSYCFRPTVQISYYIIFMIQRTI